MPYFIGSYIEILRGFNGTNFMYLLLSKTAGPWKFLPYNDSLICELWQKSCSIKPCHSGKLW